MNVRPAVVAARGTPRGLDAAIALVVAVGLMALGLSSEEGAWIALPATMAIVAGTVAIRRPRRSWMRSDAAALPDSSNRMTVPGLAGFGWLPRAATR